VALGFRSYFSHRRDVVARRAGRRPSPCHPYGFTGPRCCSLFATASTSFVVGLQYTSVANILLVQAGGPLIAASLAYLLFRERVSLGTWIAIASVIFGIAVMESESLDGAMSPIGGLLAVVISLSFALATVITRHYSHVEMIPAVTLGVMIAGVNAFFTLAV